MVDNDDTSDRIGLAQALMVEITIRLESLAERAARLQRSQNSDPGLGEDIEAVGDLIEAHARLLPRLPTRARSKT